MSHAQNQFEAIEREVNRLAKQAKQAQIYLAKKEQLKKIEINVITKDVIDRQNQLTNIATKISAKTTTTTTDNNEIKKLEDQLELDRTKFHELDQSLTDDTKL